MTKLTVIPVVTYIFTPPATEGHTDTQNRVSVQPLEIKVGAGGFEPPTSRTRTVRSSRAEPRPEFFLPAFTGSGFQTQKMRLFEAAPL